MADAPETKEAFERYLRTQLDEWSTRIDHLKAAAERDAADAEMREQLYEQLSEIRDRFEATQTKLEELKRSGEKTWKELKGDVEKLWTDLTGAVERGEERAGKRSSS